MHFRSLYLRIIGPGTMASLWSKRRAINEERFDLDPEGVRSATDREHSRKSSTSSQFPPQLSESRFVAGANHPLGMEYHGVSNPVHRTAFQELKIHG